MKLPRFRMKKNPEKSGIRIKTRLFYITTLRLIEKDCAISRCKCSVSPKRFHSQGSNRDESRFDYVQIIVECGLPGLGSCIAERNASFYDIYTWVQQPCIKIFIVGYTSSVEKVLRTLGIPPH